MKTNTTVYLSLEVWDHDSGTDDNIRYIDNLVIPFNETTASNWTVKRFTSPDGAYLEIQFQIVTCYGIFGSLGCNFCKDNYYPEGLCNVMCTAVEGKYTGSDSGKKVCNKNWKGAECDNCAEHRIGETCEKFSEGWGGNKCQDCAQDNYPERICNLKCTAVEGRYTCSDSGKKVCNKN